jgi:hypothetical protein
MGLNSAYNFAQDVAISRTCLVFRGTENPDVFLLKWFWSLERKRCSLCIALLIVVFHGSTAPSRPGPPHYRGFTITLRHTTLGRTPLDEWSVRRRDTYLTTHNNNKGQVSMLPAGFEPATPASELPHTHALDRAATEIGGLVSCVTQSEATF